MADSVRINDAAAIGYQNNTDAYVAARPSYHPDLVAHLAAKWGGGVVGEIGAGTGKFTAQMVAAGLTVIAVEPVAAMREALRESCPTVDSRAGTAEDLPFDDASVDVIVASQSFHWFDHQPALREISRALKPGGHLVTVWNVRDESIPWVAAWSSVVNQHEGTTPRWKDMTWRRAIDDDARFAFVEDWQVPNPWPTTRDGVAARALSTSFIASLPRDEQDKVAADIRDIVRDFAEPFDYPYRSELQAWRRVEPQSVSS